MRSKRQKEILKEIAKRKQRIEYEKYWEFNSLT